MYVRDKQSPFAPRNPVLCGFERVALAPGETREVRIALDKNARTVVNDAGERVPGSGHCTFYCGFSQPDARSESLTGKPFIRL